MGKKGGKKAKKALEPAELEVRDKLKVAEYEALVSANTIERTTASLVLTKRETEALRADLTATQEELVSSKEITRDITADLSRNHSRTIEVITEKMDELRKDNERLRDAVNQRDEKIEQLEQRLKDELAERERSVNALKAKMESMASHFSDLLRETLERVADRLERWDDEKVELNAPQAVA